VVFGNPTKEHADDFNSKGKKSYELRDYKQSLEYHLKSLTIRIKLFGENHADVAESYYLIGTCYN
jgi:hypothetical protein